MPMPSSSRDREQAKFRDAVGFRQSKVAVTIEQDPNTPIPVTIQGNQNSRIAGETISAIRAIFLDSGEIFIADQSVEIKSNVFGISITGSVMGGAVVVKESGELYDSSLSFTIGSPVFLSNSGQLTQTAPVSGFRVLIGYAIATNGLNINIQEPILI